MMGCDAYDLPANDQDLSVFVRSNGPGELIELINQIYLESDFFSKKRQPSTLCSLYDYVKRRKYEATFQARVR